MLKNSSIALVLSAVLLAVSMSVLADVPAYDGADRVPRLAPKAKAEGALTLYTSVNKLQHGNPIIDAFERKYGIKVTIWRAAANKVLQRALTEAKAGRFDVDVVNAGALELEALHRERLLHAVDSPHFTDLIPEAVPAHKEWVGTYMLAYVQAYNTRLVKKQDLPQRYEDLLQSKWKGRLGIESKDYDWFYTIVKHLGEEKGLALFKSLVAKNGLLVRTGHTLLANLVASGEVPLALTVYHYTPEQLKQKGAPIEWFAIKPIVVGVNAIGVLRKAPHPHAALLFYDHLISEDTQKLYVRMNYAPVSKKVASPLQNLPVKLIDPVTSLDESEKWTRLYEDIVLRPRDRSGDARP